MTDSEKTLEQRLEELQAWLSARRGGIGGTDVAALAGVHPWGKGPMEVFLDKMDRTEEVDSDAALLGRTLEKGVLDAYAERYKYKIESPGHLQGEETWERGTPDGIAIDKAGGRRLVEVKTTDRKSAHLWGEPGTDDVRSDALCQVQWYLMLTGLQVADVAVFWRDRAKIDVYHVHRDEEQIAALRKLARRFWLDHVVKNIPPTPEDAQGWRDVSDHLARLWHGPEAPTPKVLSQADPDVSELATEYHQLGKTIKKLEEERKEMGGRLRYAIADGAGFQWTEPTTEKTAKVTWIRSKDKRTTDWEAVARKVAERLDLSPIVLATIVEAETKTAPGPRVLRVHLPKGSTHEEKK